jgi:hypothetical protein
MCGHVVRYQVMCLVLDGIFDGPMSRKSQNGSNLMIDAEVLTNDRGKSLQICHSSFGKSLIVSFWDDPENSAKHCLTPLIMVLSTGAQ